VSSIHITPAVARRYLVLHHRLAPPRSLPPEKASVMALAGHLGSFQFDPLDIAGRNHDLVLNARIAGYRRELTDALLYQDRCLYETYNKGLSLVPTSDLPWFRINWDRARLVYEREEFVEHRELVAELLERIETHGSVSSTDLEPRAMIEWSWRPTNQVRAILEALALAGVIGIRERAGNRRVYDKTERLFPPDLLERRVPVHDRYRHKLLSRYRAHGLLGDHGNQEIWIGTTPYREIGLEDGVGLNTPGRRKLQAELLEEAAICRVDVEGLKGVRYIPAGNGDLLDRAEREVAAAKPPGDAAPGVAFLAPLDPLVWDRDLVRRLHGFDYLWEVYVPAAKRKWGYYVLPILFGDRLVGRIEPRFERATGTLTIIALWWEDGFDPLDASDAPGFAGAFADALAAHQAFGGMTKLSLPREARHRAFVRAVRERLA
jgi:uncharacterized protein YcaQ